MKTVSIRLGLGKVSEAYLLVRVYSLLFLTQRLEGVQRRICDGHPTGSLVHPILRYEQEAIVKRGLEFGVWSLSSD